MELVSGYLPDTFGHQEIKNLACLIKRIPEDALFRRLP
jgi:hypothetical protein